MWGRKQSTSKSFPDITNPPSDPDDDPIRQSKDLFLADGKSRIDFVLVYNKNHEGTPIMTLFLNNLKEQGLIAEKAEGQYMKEYNFLKIHCPKTLLIRSARTFNVELSFENPYYKGENRTWFSHLASDVTRPNSHSPYYERAPKTFSQSQPTNFTSAERSTVVFQLLKQIKFGTDLGEIGVLKLIEKGVVSCGYPLHDGHYAWTEEGHLNDRQILTRFWSNFRYAFKNQPLNLIEKYYGSEIAFYFACLSFQTKCLLIPSFFGILSTLIGIILLISNLTLIDEEICNSNLIICTQCSEKCVFTWLKSSCSMTKYAFVLDNPATIFYGVLMSLWGGIYLKLWRRKEAMLSLRWNLMGAHVRRPMRSEFKENAPRTRISSITGEIEYFIPKTKKILFYTISYSIVVLMVLIYIFINMSVIWCRLYMQEESSRRSFDFETQSKYQVVETLVGAFIQTVAVMAIAGTHLVYVPFFSRTVEYLTRLRMPRSEAQFSKIYRNKMFLIHFTINFTPLFYLAFFRGTFNVRPGDSSALVSREFTAVFKHDVCKPYGCFVTLAATVMTFLIVLNFFSTVKYCSCSLYVKWMMSKYKVKNLEYLEEWERSMFLNDYDKNFNLDSLYVDLWIQYGMVVFFMSAFPLASAVVIGNNIFQIQLISHQLTRHFRRPVARKVPNIGIWDKLMWAITLLGIILNSVSLTFSSEAIQQMIYLFRHHSLKGYTNSTLSRIEVNSVYQNVSVSFCYYRGNRYPSGDSKEFELTDEFWSQLLVKSFFFIVFENACLLIFLFMSYIIPEVPRKIKVKLEHDEKKLRQERLNMS